MKQKVQKPKTNRTSSSGSLRENLLRRKKVKRKIQDSEKKSLSQIQCKTDNNSPTSS